MLPPGFERLLLGHAVAVARSDVAMGVRRALVGADGSRSTLHEFAARQPNARSLQGRGTAYAVALPPAGIRVVVRHNHHGGAFASLTRDRFLAPTRAPHELDVSLAIAKLGVRTPEILAYVLYPPGGVLQRADVVSREIPGSRDLADVLCRDGAPERAAALAAAAGLVAQLAAAGVRHHDLNAKNVLLAPDGAYVLDVDRASVAQAPGQAIESNLARLARSLRKWRDRFGARITEADIAELETVARHAIRDAARTV